MSKVRRKAPPPTHKTMITVKKLIKRFGLKTILRGVDFEVQPGEFVALLGPSGCGKSTALNCIAGLLDLSAGRIWLDDLRIDVLPPEKRGFGMVFQNYALFPHMNVRSNIGFGLRMRRIASAEIDKRVAQALALVQLEGHVDNLPGQLSGASSSVSRLLARSSSNRRWC